MTVEHGSSATTTLLPGPTNVVRALPAHVAPSVRRTSSLILTPDPSWFEGLRLTACARDLLVRADGATEVVDALTVHIGIDNRSQVSSIEGPVPDLARQVIGRSVVAGFRAALAELYRAGLEEDSLIAAVLDDIPTVRLIAGYAHIMETPPKDAPHGSPKTDICAGWAEDATAHRRAISDGILVMPTPSAPAIGDMVADPIDFHNEPPTTPGSMRRRRILEVARVDSGLHLTQYFRDSHIDLSGREGSLHEYLMTAAADSDDTGTVRDIDVQARALPFPECPLAAGYSGELVGMPLAEASRGVRNRLVGTHSCTHLNDTLRYLRFVPALGRLIV
jgi:hypothetical protein